MLYQESGFLRRPAHALYDETAKTSHPTRLFIMKLGALLSTLVELIVH